MSVSVGSQVTDGGRSDGITVASEVTAASNRVMVEQFFPADSSLCATSGLLPVSPKFVSLNEQCIATKVYTINEEQTKYRETMEVQLSAFLSEIDSNGNHIVEITCNPTKKSRTTKSCFRFEFEDEVRNAQILPLPISTHLKRQEASTETFSGIQSFGVLLVALSKRSGVSIHSIILSRDSHKDPFHITEFLKVSRCTLEDFGRFPKVSTCLHRPASDEDQNLSSSGNHVLYMGILSHTTPTKSHRVDVIACNLVTHKSILYTFGTHGPTRASKRSLVLTGASNSASKDLSMCIGQGSCAVAVLLESELQVVKLPYFEKWGQLSLKPEDISINPFDYDSGETASQLFHFRMPRKAGMSFGILFCPNFTESANKSQTTSDNNVHSDFYLRHSLQNSTRKDVEESCLRVRDVTLGNIQHALRRDEAAYDQSHCRSVDSYRQSMKLKVHNESIMSQNERSIDCLTTCDYDQSSKDRESPTSTVPSTNSLPQTGLKGTCINLNQDFYRKPLEKHRLEIISFSRNDTASKKKSVFKQSIYLPSNFSIQAESMAMAQIRDSIILAAISPGSSCVNYVRIPFFPMTDSASSIVQDAVRTLEIDCPNYSDVTSLGIEVGNGKTFRLRIIIRTDLTVHGRTVYNDLRKFNITQSAMEIPVDTLFFDYDRKSTTEDNSRISEKLDLILRAMKRFESDVHQRLDFLEHKEHENSERLLKLERSILVNSSSATRIEI